MLSDDLRYLATQVRFFHSRQLDSRDLNTILIERLEALADRAAAMETAAVPPHARGVVVAAAANVVRLDQRRARR
jgi:hypothetical protein